MKASAVEVKMIPSDELTLPPEFQVSLYENLIEQLRKSAVFPRVYDDGDRNADNAADLITLECTVVKFKKGNETLREVTTDRGRNFNDAALRVHGQGRELTTCASHHREGTVLRATHDFAIKLQRSRMKTFLLAPQVLNNAFVTKTVLDLFRTFSSEKAGLCG